MDYTPHDEEEEKISEHLRSESAIEVPKIEWDKTKYMVVVFEPFKTTSGYGGHTTYKMKGEDDQGVFESVRRYNEFYILRKTLSKRFPGFFIPPIPGK